MVVGQKGFRVCKDVQGSLENPWEFLSEDVGVGFLRNLGPETGLGLRVTLQP